MSKKLHITFDGNDLKVTQDTTGTNNVELYPKSAIVGVNPVKMNTKPSNGVLEYTSPSGDFALAETVTGGTSGATGVVNSFKGSSGLTLTSVSGTFVKGETITGGTSTETATVDIYDATSFPGEWIYPYRVMTVVEIDFIDGARLNIELQDVSNQNTWNTGNQAGINAAIAAINTWLKA